MKLRPDLLNIIGFYDLLDSEQVGTPFDAMRYQAYFTASSVHVAHEVMKIVNEFLDESGL